MVLSWQGSVSAHRLGFLTCLKLYIIRWHLWVWSQVKESVFCVQVQTKFSLTSFEWPVLFLVVSPCQNVCVHHPNNQADWSTPECTCLVIMRFRAHNGQETSRECYWSWLDATRLIWNALAGRVPTSAAALRDDCDDDEDDQPAEAHVSEGSMFFLGAEDLSYHRAFVIKASVCSRRGQKDSFETLLLCTQHLWPFQSHKNTFEMKEQNRVQKSIVLLLT